MRKTKRQKVKLAGSVQRFTDGIQNPLLRIGDYTRNTSNASRYVPKFETIKRQQLEWLYQGSWIGSMAIDIVAEDMTREGIDIKAKDPTIVDAINSALDDFRVWDSIADGLRWGRLYGGAIAVILIDGQDMGNPMKDVPIGSFKGIYVFDRWQLKPSDELVQQYGPDFGKPKFYEVLAGVSDVQIPGGKIHHSRVIRFEGRKMPAYVRPVYQGWGASVLEPIIDTIKMFDLATAGAGQLLSKAYLRYYKVKGLREILTNDLASKGFLKQMDYVRLYQGIEGMTLGDAEDDFQTMSYTFTGIPEIMLQIAQQISGYLGIPLVRLFGQSPTGFNATGESDIRMYYDNLRHQQDSSLRPGMKKLLRVIYQSLYGKNPEADFSFEFRSLWQMTNEQKANTARTIAETVITSFRDGVITLPVALKELKNISDSLGVFASITDEDIQAAEEMENEEPPNPNDVDNEDGNLQEKIKALLSGTNEDSTAGGVVSKATEEDRQKR